MDRHSRAREIREQRGLSVADLATKAGLARQTIYSIERDPEHKPGVDVIVKIAQALEVTVDELLGTARVA